MKKALSMLLVLGLSIGILSGCSAGNGGSGGSSNSGKDVIKVNDTTLKSGYIDARVNQIFQQNQLEAGDSMAEYYKAEIISSLVDTELLVQEAKKRKIEVKPDDVKKLKEDLINQRYGSQENFDKYLEEYKIDESMLNRMLEEKIYYDKLSEKLKKDVKVDAQAYYDANKDQFKVADQVKAKHILVKDEETAKKVIEKLDSGEDFAKLAKEYSTDPGTKDNGGELGYFTADAMVKEFSDATFALNVGEYTKTPVKTSYGYHVILSEDKKAAHDQTFDEVKDQLTQQLKDQEVEAKINELLTKLKKDEKTKIEYLSDDYNPTKIKEKAQKAAEKAQKDDSKGSASAESVQDQANNGEKAENEPAISPEK